MLILQCPKLVTDTLTPHSRRKLYQTRKDRSFRENSQTRIRKQLNSEHTNQRRTSTTVDQANEKCILHIDEVNTIDEVNIRHKSEYE